MRRGRHVEARRSRSGLLHVARQSLPGVDETLQDGPDRKLCGRRDVPLMHYSLDAVLNGGSGETERGRAHSGTGLATSCSLAVDQPPSHQASAAMRSCATRSPSNCGNCQMDPTAITATVTTTPSASRSP